MCDRGQREAGVVGRSDRRRQRADAGADAGWLLTSGRLFLLPAVGVVEGVPGGIDAAAMGGYFWLGLAGGLIADTLWFRGIGRLP